jgi:hypothetical protein
LKISMNGCYLQNPEVVGIMKRLVPSTFFKEGLQA